jgi:hypothetical protein
VFVVRRALDKKVLEKEATFWLNAKVIHAKSAAKKCHK